MVAFSASRLIWPVMLPISSTIPLIACEAALSFTAWASAASARAVAFAAFALDLVMVSEISRIEALISSLPAATDSIRPRAFSAFLRWIAWAVMSLAYFTTLYGLPLRSKIGL